MSGVTRTIVDISGHINTLQDLLVSPGLPSDVRTGIEAAKTLLTELKNKFEVLLQDLQQSRKKRSTGTYIFIEIMMKIHLSNHKIELLWGQTPLINMLFLLLFQS